MLEAESVKALVRALDAAQVGDLAKLAAAVEQTTTVLPEEAANIANALRSLYLIKARSECSLTDLVELLVGAMQMTGGDLALSESEKPPYKEKLTWLLSIDSLERSTKVEQLRSDHQNVLEDAKIVTDLRPVFNNPGERPVGAIIAHTLKIVTHEFGEHKELYFALDNDDILVLKRIAERALEKSNSLKDLLKSADVKDLT